MLCTIPSNDMLAVERVDESAFGMKFVSIWLLIFGTYAIDHFYNLTLDVPAHSTREDSVYAGQK